MTQVELKFPTLEAATAYCERQGLYYGIQWPHDGGLTSRYERLATAAQLGFAAALRGSGYEPFHGLLTRQESYPALDSYQVQLASD